MVPAFGVRSAPCIFTCLADLVVWIATRNYAVTFLMHFVDDFHTLGLPGSLVCQHNLGRSIHCFSKLGISLQLRPSTCVTILGKELDSENLQARLPKDKFESLKRFCKWKDLDFLIGHLQHAGKVVPQGQSFLSRMINLLCAVRRYHHLIHLI